MRMLTKADLINELHDSGTVNTKALAEAAVDTIINGIAADLAAGGGVILKGFGRLHVAERGPSVGRNPRTGEVIQIPAKRVVRFKPALALTNRLNGG